MLCYMMYKIPSGVSTLPTRAGLLARSTQRDSSLGSTRDRFSNGIQGCRYFVAGSLRWSGQERYGHAVGMDIPQGKLTERPVERLISMGKKRDRSVNYLVVQAILEYLDREERK